MEHDITRLIPACARPYAVLRAQVIGAHGPDVAAACAPSGAASLVMTKSGRAALSFSSSAVGS